MVFFSSEARRGQPAKCGCLLVLTDTFHHAVSLLPLECLREELGENDIPSVRDVII